ncbi:PREDICTED: dermcidin [Chinchilla lanigera]|uniref:dermcidin n=1 Tax=Chinchilla lanigera TaxID=34839 RepID=UPI00069908B0|nr:PREDICTED: dermcidin [Chinchilla lanigera]
MKEAQQDSTNNFSLRISGFCSIPALRHASMRFLALLFLAALVWALVCAGDPDTASTPGSVNEPHKTLVAKKENAENPGLTSKTPKPSRNRRSGPLETILEKGQEGLEMIKEIKDSVMQKIEALKRKGEGIRSALARES